jgi:hypothetical protein
LQREEDVSDGDWHDMVLAACKIDFNSIGRRACILHDLAHTPGNKRSGQVKANVEIELDGPYATGAFVLTVTETVAHDTGRIVGKTISTDLSADQVACLVSYLTRKT